MLLTPNNTDASPSLGPYWRAAAICILLLAAYIALIMTLHTETAARSTAPPWYSWVRYPPTRTRLQSIYLVLPAIVFACWIAIIRRSLRRPMPAAAIMLLGFCATLLLNATVAMMDGSPAAISKPFSWAGSEFFSDVPAVHGIKSFLTGYVANLYHYSIHTRTHPPGAVLFLYFVRRLFGPGITAAAWAAVVTTATGIVPYYLLARRLGGPHLAVLSVALYPVTPSLVLFGATSMDGVFLVPLLWSLYFLQRTISLFPSLGTPGEGQGEGLFARSIFNAIATGIILTISLLFSYVTVCIGVMMLIYTLLEWAHDPKLLKRLAIPFTLIALLIVTLLGSIYFSTGFNYLDCLKNSRHYDHYAMRTFTLSFGRYIDISFCNLIAFLIGVGLPSVILWSRETIDSLKLRTSIDRFNLSLALSVVIFSFARLFTHETERVWLFFIPPALIAAASHIARRGKDQQPLLEWALCLSFAQTWLFQLLLYTIW